MSTLRVTTLQNASGVEVYTCKAWVNFNGTGTVAIRGSGNVSSITDNGTGDYTINFTTAMSDANYSAVGSGYRVSGSYIGVCTTYGTQTTTACPVQLVTDTGGLVDSAVCSFAVFR